MWYFPSFNIIHHDKNQLIFLEKEGLNFIVIKKIWADKGNTVAGKQMIMH